jgi:hypothetical protein
MEMKGKVVEEEGQKTEDIQIAQRIIADVKALLTCVPYLSSAPNSLLIRPLLSTIIQPPIGSLNPCCWRGLNSLVSNSTR